MQVNVIVNLFILMNLVWLLRNYQQDIHWVVFGIFLVEYYNFVSYKYEEINERFNDFDWKGKIELVEGDD